MGSNPDAKVPKYQSQGSVSVTIHPTRLFAQHGLLSSLTLSMSAVLTHGLRLIIGTRARSPDLKVTSTAS